MARESVASPSSVWGAEHCLSSALAPSFVSLEPASLGSAQTSS